MNESSTEAVEAATEKHILESFQDMGPNIVGSLTTNYNRDIIESSLAQFLERPILIGTFSSTTPSDDIYPIATWLSNPAIDRVLANYKGLSATLNVRISMSTTPYIYGLETWSARYHLLGYEKDYSSTSLTTLETVYMDPSVPEPQEMQIPFQWLYDYIDLKTSSAETGGIYHIQLHRRRHVPFRSANSAVEPDVTITMHVWMTNVKLVAPVPTDVIPQSSEYNGVISKPAGILSRIAGRLTDFPIIGNYARATQIGSGALAAIAAIFGFSKPINLKPPAAVYTQPHRNMYTSTALDVANKMTIDPKQECSISPSVLGGGENDPLAFSNIVKRFYMMRTGLGSGGIVWNTTDANETILANIPVQPGIVFLGVNSVTPAPCAAVAMCFKFWRGTMIYRLRVNSSQFHRGRLRLFWSPNIISFPTADNISNTTYNWIVDIVNDKVIEIHIPWGSIEHFKNVNMISTTIDPGVTDVYSSSNGYLYIQVIQQLQSPLTSQGITMTLEVAMSDDCAFAVPSLQLLDQLHLSSYLSNPTQFDGQSYVPTVTADINKQWGFAQPNDFRHQSADMPGPKPTRNIKITMFPAIGSNKDYLEKQIGEVFVSFRPMFKAYQPYQVRNSTYKLRGFYNVPMLTENDGTGNQVVYSPTWLAYVSSFFLARRGGIRYKLYTEAHDSRQPGVFAYRIRMAATNYAQSVTSLSDNFISQIIAHGLQGHSLGWDNTLTVEVPTQVATRYIPAVPPNGPFHNVGGVFIDLDNTYDGVLFMKFNDLHNDYLYIAAAEDFTLDVFNLIPRFRTWTTNLPINTG